MCPVYFLGEPYILWSQLYHCVFNCNLFDHPPFQVCLRLCALVSLKAFFQFCQGDASETSEEMKSLYLSCIKLNPGVFYSDSLGNLP